MPCNQCGSCRYANASTAKLRIKVTSNGLSAGCQPDGEAVFTNIPYFSPGVWKQTIPDVGLVSVHSRCISGEWLWSVPAGVAGGGGGGLPPGCGETIGVDVSQVIRSDCGGYEDVVVTTYDSAWVKVETKIDIENNAECA